VGRGGRGLTGQSSRRLYARSGPVAWGVWWGGNGVSELVCEDVTLQVQVEGRGEPVTVFAHGLTNRSIPEIVDLVAAFLPE
jgi:hypothetical protein